MIPNSNSDPRYKAKLANEENRQLYIWLSDQLDKVGRDEPYKRGHYSKAMKHLTQVSSVICNSKQALALNNVGKAMAHKISDYLKSIDVYDSNASSVVIDGIDITIKVPKPRAKKVGDASALDDPSHRTVSDTTQPTLSPLPHNNDDIDTPVDHDTDDLFGYITDDDVHGNDKYNDNNNNNSIFDNNNNSESADIMYPNSAALSSNTVSSQAINNDDDMKQQQQQQQKLANKRQRDGKIITRTASTMLSSSSSSLSPPLQFPSLSQDSLISLRPRGSGPLYIPQPHSGSSAILLVLYSHALLQHALSQKDNNTNNHATTTTTTTNSKTAKKSLSFSPKVLGLPILSKQSIVSAANAYTTISMVPTPNAPSHTYGTNRKCNNNNTTTTTTSSSNAAKFFCGWTSHTTLLKHSLIVEHVKTGNRTKQYSLTPLGSFIAMICHLRDGDTAYGTGQGILSVLLRYAVEYWTIQAGYPIQIDEEYLANIIIQTSSTTTTPSTGTTNHHNISVTHLEYKSPLSSTPSLLHISSLTALPSQPVSSASSSSSSTPLPPPPPYFSPEHYDIVLLVDSRERITLSDSGTSSSSSSSKSSSARSVKRVPLVDTIRTILASRKGLNSINTSSPSFDSIHVEGAELPVGDFMWVAQSKHSPLIYRYILDIIIERKTTMDLADSIRSDRFTNQRIRLTHSQLPSIVYIIEDPAPDLAGLNIANIPLIWSGGGGSTRGNSGTNIKIDDNDNNNNNNRMSNSNKVTPSSSSSSKSSSTSSSSSSSTSSSSASASSSSSSSSSTSSSTSSTPYGRESLLRTLIHNIFSLNTQHSFHRIHTRTIYDTVETLFQLDVMIRQYYTRLPTTVVATATTSSSLTTTQPSLSAIPSSSSSLLVPPPHTSSFTLLRPPSILPRPLHFSPSIRGVGEDFASFSLRMSKSSDLTPLVIFARHLRQIKGLGQETPLTIAARYPSYSDLYNLYHRIVQYQDCPESNNPILALAASSSTATNKLARKRSRGYHHDINSTYNDDNSTTIIHNNDTNISSFPINIFSSTYSSNDTEMMPSLPSSSTHHHHLPVNQQDVTLPQVTHAYLSSLNIAGINTLSSSIPSISYIQPHTINILQHSCSGLQLVNHKYLTNTASSKLYNHILFYPPPEPPPPP